jgi:hypothetical protein
MVAVGVLDKEVCVDVDIDVDEGLIDGVAGDNSCVVVDTEDFADGAVEDKSCAPVNIDED